MTSNATTRPSPERRAAIARLVQKGEMKYAQPGQYFEREEQKDSFPQYEVAPLVEAFPEALQIDFDEDLDEDGNRMGMVAIIKDGNSAGVPDVRVKLGMTPPPTTKELIEVIRAHYKSEFNLQTMQETNAVFDELDKDD